MSAKLKHRCSIGYNYMAGTNFGMWMRALAENGFRISPAYVRRVAFITLASPSNSAAATTVTLRFGKAIGKSQITEPPPFILGHWRSGTNLLHDLLAQDEIKRIKGPRRPQSCC